MKVLYVADGQNPHAIGFISLFSEDLVERHIATTYPILSPAIQFKSVTNIPFDFSASLRASHKSQGYHSKNKSALNSLKGTAIWSAGKKLRDKTAILALPKQARKLKELIRATKPDLVHAFRLPFEGYIAGLACKDLKVPLLISTWGNDFTLYANQSRNCAYFSRIAMSRANGLHPDCLADYIRAVDYGFQPYRPFEVLPGNGGLDLDTFNPHASSETLAATLDLPSDAVLVLNPRGWRSYVRNDIYWSAASIVAKRFPNVYFAAVAMEGMTQAETMVKLVGLEGRALLLPPLNKNEMASLFARAQVTVSLAEHDGMPNSVIESMACGSYPVALDLPSLREVIKNGENGDLIFYPDPLKVAEAIIAAIEDQEKRERARLLNVEKMSRFGREATRAKALELYERTLHHGNPLAYFGLESPKIPSEAGR